MLEKNLISFFYSIYRYTNGNNNKPLPNDFDNDLEENAKEIQRESERIQREMELERKKKLISTPKVAANLNGALSAASSPDVSVIIPLFQDKVSAHEEDKAIHASSAIKCPDHFSHSLATICSSLPSKLSKPF